jgi:transposase
MRGYKLSDFEWGVIAPLLPNKPRGVPRVDDWRVVNGIFWVLRTGAPWRALPKEFGPQTTCYNRFVRRRKAGVWDRILAAVTTAYDGNVQMIDSYFGARASACRQLKKSHPDRCMGRSRGGLTTKIHAWTNARGLLLELVPYAGPGERPSGCPWLLGCSGIYGKCWATRLTTPIGRAARSKPPGPHRERCR